MLTLIVYAVVALIVVGALVVLAVMVLPGTEQLAPAPPDRTPWALPADRAMSEGDVSTLKLPVTLRGYRFAETDAVLDRLGAEITHRDQVIADLLAKLDDAEPAPGETGEVLVTDAARSAATTALEGRIEPALVEQEDDLTELGEVPEDTDGPAPALDALADGGRASDLEPSAAAAAEYESPQVEQIVVAEELPALAQVQPADALADELPPAADLPPTDAPVEEQRAAPVVVAIDEDFSDADFENPDDGSADAIDRDLARRPPSDDPAGPDAR